MVPPGSKPKLPGSEAKAVGDVASDLRATLCQGSVAVATLPLAWRGLLRTLIFQLTKVK